MIALRRASFSVRIDTNPLTTTNPIKAEWT
jgi:hypothetical protein